MWWNLSSVKHYYCCTYSVNHFLYVLKTRDPQQCSASVHFFQGMKPHCRDILQGCELWEEPFRVVLFVPTVPAVSTWLRALENFTITIRWTEHETVANQNLGITYHTTHCRMTRIIIIMFREKCCFFFWFCGRWNTGSKSEHFLPFWWLCYHKSFLTPDTRAPLHLLKVMLDVRCGFSKTKRFHYTN